MSIDLLNGSAVMVRVETVAETAAEFIGVAGGERWRIPKREVREDKHGAFSRSFRRDELAPPTAAELNASLSAAGFR